MSMNRKNLKMAAYFLRMAADSYSNHGCNDLDCEFIAACGLSDTEKTAFAAELFAWNGDDLEREATPQAFDNLQDFALMQFLANKLETLADGEFEQERVQDAAAEENCVNEPSS